MTWKKKGREWVGILKEKGERVKKLKERGFEDISSHSRTGEAVDQG